ncbi:hypothetical protein vBDshSR4C_031 [Dinoroseobacter phage vB_DshS-R4C]|nr:hypothetical protein vBDshSR4C_031 [Dinoroseobacter phage vB_DshS-R4C]
MTIALNGTAGADTFATDQRIWTGPTVTGYNGYTVSGFELGVDQISTAWDGGTVTFSTLAEFQAAMLDIEATGLTGFSPLGDTYTLSDVDGDTVQDITFSWGGDGALTLLGLGAALDLGPSILTGVQGTARADTISVSYDAGLTNVIDSGYGDDTVYGGQWSDSLSNQGGSDTVFLGGGDDFYYGADDAAGVDTVSGGSGDDTIFTYGGADVIDAGAGDDTVVAGQGADVIDLGDGVDTYIFGGGDDIVTGGSNRDTFVFSLVSGGGDVTITDLDLQDGTVGGSGEDIVEFLYAGQSWVLDNSDDLDALDAQSWASVTTVGDDLFIDIPGALTITAEDFFA